MLTKKEILDSLKRIAKENGGQTPAQKKFKELTRFGQYDLHKYDWANYGELCAEAGLTPNIFDKTKFSHEDLCKLFIKAIREKGKWPTRAILEIKHKKDTKFPAPVTFYEQLGLVKTAELQQSIIEYIKNKPKYTDILNICNIELKKYQFDNEDEGNSPDKSNYGWVYLIKHGNRKEYRIGSTANPMRRLGENRIELPEGAEPVHSIETLDKTGVESYWHTRFKSKQMNGDWFKLLPEDIKEFKRWKKIY